MNLKSRFSIRDKEITHTILDLECFLFQLKWVRIQILVLLLILSFGCREKQGKTISITNNHKHYSSTQHGDSLFAFMKGPKESSLFAWIPETGEILWQKKFPTESYGPSLLWMKNFILFPNVEGYELLNYPMGEVVHTWNYKGDEGNIISHEGTLLLFYNYFEKMFLVIDGQNGRRLDSIDVAEYSPFNYSGRLSASRSVGTILDKVMLIFTEDTILRPNWKPAGRCHFSSIDDERWIWISDIKMSVIDLPSGIVRETPIPLLEYESRIVQNKDFFLASNPNSGQLIALCKNPMGKSFSHELSFNSATPVQNGMLIRSDNQNSIFFISEEGSISRRNIGEVPCCIDAAYVFGDFVVAFPTSGAVFIRMENSPAEIILDAAYWKENRQTN